MFSFMRTGMAFMAVGIMEAAFEDALAYAQERETFGEPIGQHQLVQEKLYDVRTAIETSRGLSRSAAEALVDGDPDARLRSSLAKGTPANSRSTRPATRCRCWARRGWTSRTAWSATIGTPA